MANPRIENLDEFDEAEVLCSTFCERMTEEEYEEQTSAETQKALDALCSYLQANPEHYFRIIRKRKQEEMENAGLFSYLKVKMMGFLHGERYPACLVSPEQSADQLSRLKMDMHKAFTYSEESKGRRFSKRIASRTAYLVDTLDKENTPVTTSQSTTRRTRLNTEEKHSSLTGASVVGSARGLRSLSVTSKTTPPRKTSLPPVATVIPNQTMSASNDAVPVVAPPPPPPPPPPILFQHQLGIKKVSASLGNIRKCTPTSAAIHNKRNLRKRSLSRKESGHSSEETLALPENGLPPHKQKVSPTSQWTDRSAGGQRKGGSRTGSPSSPSDTDAEFVTPEADVLSYPKRHKRTLSNASVGSLTSLSSLNNIHSELMSSNPLRRLRSTQIARSPGGTPLRFGPSTPQEPLHKALVTVLREKFKNVRTPSPLAMNSTSAFSPDIATNSSFNGTFTP